VRAVPKWNGMMEAGSSPGFMIFAIPLLSIA
jgi:hypothetical protein